MKIRKLSESAPDGNILTFNNIKEMWGNIGTNAEFHIDSDDDLKRQLSKDSGELGLTYLERALLGTGLKIEITGEEYIHVAPYPKTIMDKGILVEPIVKDDELCLLVFSTSRQKKYLAFGDPIGEIHCLRRGIQVPE